MQIMGCVRMLVRTNPYHFYEQLQKSNLEEKWVTVIKIVVHPSDFLDTSGKQDSYLWVSTEGITVDDRNTKVSRLKQLDLFLRL